MLVLLPCGCAVENIATAHPPQRTFLAAPDPHQPKMRKPVQGEPKYKRANLELPKNPVKPPKPLTGRVRFQDYGGIPALNKSGATRKWAYTARDVGAKSAREARQNTRDEYCDKFDPRDMKSYQRFARHHPWRASKNPLNWRGPLLR